MRQNNWEMNSFVSWFHSSRHFPPRRHSFTHNPTAIQLIGRHYHSLPLYCHRGADGSFTYEWIWSTMNFANIIGWRKVLQMKNLFPKRFAYHFVAILLLLLSAISLWVRDTWSAPHNRAAAMKRSTKNPFVKILDGFTGCCLKLMDEDYVVGRFAFHLKCEWLCLLRFAQFITWFSDW